MTTPIRQARRSAVAREFGVIEWVIVAGGPGSYVLGDLAARSANSPVLVPIAVVCLPAYVVAGVVLIIRLAGLRSRPYLEPPPAFTPGP
ncbi:hypothetical protein [Bailinhaonella thermotolerans]|uniref:Uncharacterized protein n=1 Tax=Bailinhaonella thermotolerans TaxID=1070861 RepID=A0A3A4A109_9ACTN|nr:hypothetical protein [Bailinhaonella thermotolerans]RJL22079.1 hypothetical protein D5H75_36415 [Bailinhaonella thermotolerans]